MEQEVLGSNPRYHPMLIKPWHDDKRVEFLKEYFSILSKYLSKKARNAIISEIEVILENEDGMFDVNIGYKQIYLFKIERLSDSKIAKQLLLDKDDEYEKEIREVWRY